MKCSECRKLLVELSEGLLENGLEQRVRGHLSACEACRRELEDFRSSLGLILHAESLGKSADPPADFADRVMARVRQDMKARFPSRGLVLGALAACLLLVFGAIMLYRTGFREKQSYQPVPDNAVFALRSDHGDAARAAPIPEADMESLYYAKMELARLLTRTLETLERGEPEWEIEI